MSDKAPGAMGKLASTGSNLFARPSEKKPEKKVEPKKEATKSEPRAEKTESKPAAKPTPKSPKGDVIQEIDTGLIEIWPYADRPRSEMGDVEELSYSITSSGQSVPALVRPIGKGKYELIYGRRRYEACKLAGIKLKVVIKELPDNLAFIEQANENSKRENLSAWARSMSYQKALDGKMFKSTSALAASLGLDRTTVSNIMTFQRLPKSLLDRVGDWSLVGIQTAKAILSALSDNPKFEDTLVEHKDKLVAGKLGPAAIRKLAEGRATEKGSQSEQVKTSSGLPVFSMGTNSKGEVTISILSGGRSLVDSETLKRELLELFEKNRV